MCTGARCLCSIAAMVRGERCNHHARTYDYTPEDRLILDWLCLLLFPPLGDRPGGDAGAAVDIWAWDCPGAAGPCLGRGCAGASCGSGATGSPSLTSSACFMSYRISFASCLSPTKMSSIYDITSSLSIQPTQQILQGYHQFENSKAWLV